MAVEEDAWAGTGGPPAGTVAYGKDMQPSFDPRHRRLGNASIQFAPFTGPQFWGSIHPWGRIIEPLDFLFNPNSIRINYSSNPNILPVGALDQTQVNPSLPVGDSNTNISFTLLFDRTYEVLDGSLSLLGVLADVLQLERLTGITPSQPVMHITPVKIYLGKHDSFHYKALIKSFTVTYVMFNRDMIPTRCTVEINSTRLASEPFASAEQVELYSGEDWRSKVIQQDGGGAKPQTSEPAPADAAPAPSSNNAWVNAVAGNGT